MKSDMPKSSGAGIRLSIDPVSRIHGPLRLEARIEQGVTQEVWLSAQMWRAMESTLRGHDPLTAWLTAQRVCGECTTTHAIASVRAVEQALALTIPDNAQRVRNLMLCAHALHNHIGHFYQRSLLDWVEVPAALYANPQRTAQFAESLGSWPHNSRHTMETVQQRLRTLLADGRGPFASGHWQHPAMQLPPELNLLAMTHYFQSLEAQQQAAAITATCGGKAPHIQNLAVGGIANPISATGPTPINLPQLLALEPTLTALEHFVKEVYLTDVALLAAFYPEWSQRGSGSGHYLALPELPYTAEGASRFTLPGGYYRSDQPNRYRPILSQHDPYFNGGVIEATHHTWLHPSQLRHPWVGEGQPDFNGFQPEAGYSWVKAPTFYGQRVEVGPLAGLLLLLTDQHPQAHHYLNRSLDQIHSLSATPDLSSAMLHSTLGRHLARAIRSALLVDALRHEWQALVDNIIRGDQLGFIPPTLPSGERRGMGCHEAPGGALAHWITIDKGRIRNYQIVAPATWNASPRDQHGQPGPCESALTNHPVSNHDHPLELLRTLHAFDPCMVCAAQ